MLIPASVVTRAATSAPMGQPYKSGAWITQAGITQATNNTLTQSKLSAFTFWVPDTTTFDALGIRVTASDAAATIRLGVYAADDDNLPGTLLLDAGTVSAASTGDKKIESLSLLLDPGWYWACGVAQGGTPGASVAWQNVPVIPFGYHIGGFGATTQFNFQGACPRHNADVTGALPATFVTDLLDNGSGGNTVRIFLRVA